MSKRNRPAKHQHKNDYAQFSHAEEVRRDIESGAFEKRIEQLRNDARKGGVNVDNIKLPTIQKGKKYLIGPRSEYSSALLIYEENMTGSRFSSYNYLAH